MIVCPNCGKKVDNDVKYCPECGTCIRQVIHADKKEPKEGKEDPNNAAERKQTYAGMIYKCPNCGEMIHSFTAFCPSCGYEINSATVSRSVELFIDGINTIDNEIAYDNATVKKGWASWGFFKKAGWILLNLYTLFIPLFIYLILPQLGIGGSVKLTPGEKHKIQFINNYTFPNDRENILEGLLFIKSQADSLASGKVDRNSYGWIKVWRNKASQLFDKAQILFKNDSIALDTYSAIIKDEQKMKGKLIGKSVIAAVLIVLFAVFVSSYSLLGRNIIPNTKEGIPTITEETETDSSKGIYTYQIRNYVGMNLASIGQVQGEKLIDEYGHGELHLVIVTQDGMYIPADNDTIKQHFVVVSQSIDPGKNLTIVNQRDSSGYIYDNLVEYQSYDEMILYVSPVNDKTYSPEYTAIQPTLDRHIYHVRDYVGRNALSIGDEENSKRVDHYGDGELRITFKCDDGSYVDTNNKDKLKRYLVVEQNVAPNTELKIEYETDSDGEEYSSLIQNQNYEVITLNVIKLDDSVINKSSKLEEPDDSDDSLDSDESIKDKELSLKYKVNKVLWFGTNDATITGYKGKGDTADIEDKIDGHKVTVIGKNAFKKCKSLKTVTFWADIVSIEKYAFYKCTQLQEIDIPDTTTYIGKHAFDGCKNLESLTLWGDPEIDDYAFAGCENLTEVSIGEGTKRIGKHAFDGCKKLETVYIWGDDTIVEKGAFDNCPKLKDRPDQE